jgi:hypothetical protein
MIINAVFIIPSSVGRLSFMHVREKILQNLFCVFIPCRDLHYSSQIEIIPNMKFIELLFLEILRKIICIISTLSMHYYYSDKIIHLHKIFYILICF